QLTERSYHLQAQLQAFLDQEIEFNQILEAKTAEVQAIETQKTSLQAELAQLLAQLEEQLRQQEGLNQELVAPELQQTYVEALQHQQIELEQTLEAKAAEVQELETQKTFLQAELTEVSAQLEEQRHQQEGLNQEVVALEQLEVRSQQLQTQVETLQQQQIALEQTLEAKAAEVQVIEAQKH